MIQIILDSIKLWQWWICQGFALAGLAFVVISMQQKDIKKLLWYRFFAVALIVVGLCFTAKLPNGVPPVVLGGAGLVQVVIAMLFVYKPTAKPSIKLAAGAVLGVLVIVLNIIFSWPDWYHYLVVLATIYGLVGLVAFFQKKPAITRILVVAACVIGIVYFMLLGLLINAVIDAIALCSAAVGIIRFDIKKKKSKEKTLLPQTANPM